MSRFLITLGAAIAVIALIIGTVCTLGVEQAYSWSRPTDPRYSLSHRSSDFLLRRDAQLQIGCGTDPDHTDHNTLGV